MAALRPAVVGTDICLDLALGRPEAMAFFEDPPVEIRLSTVTYLILLGEARTEEEMRRIQQFVAPYPVLSLGPVASSTAVALVREHHLTTGLLALDALVAATALAHEIPLYTRNAAFHGIPDLELVAPYE